MTSRFTAAYPKSTFDGFKVYLTNGEPWSELKNLAPVGTMWSGTVENRMPRGDFLRGGSSKDYIWIEEQMMCKRGTRTRNEAQAAGLIRDRDDTVRTFDQVIHEFSHSIDSRFGLENSVARNFGSTGNAVERFPQSIQGLFGAPAIPITGTERAFLNTIFSSTTTYSCNMYPLAEVSDLKLEIGKQYAFPEAKNIFRYFQLTSVTKKDGVDQVRIDVCPKPGQLGSILLTGADGLTTVEAARKQGLTPKSEPCSSDHGVFTNGASLPNAWLPG